MSRITYHVFRFFDKIDVGLVIAALLTLFIIQNLLQPGLPAAADIPIHLYRAMEYERAWAPGVIVPRWAPNLAFGYGYPLFVFAPPLPYLFSLTFHWLGFNFEVALKALIILIILLYAIGMYLLARDILGSVEAGMIAATAYAFAPFALREALLYGGNVPQFLAIGLFPWTLWAMTRAACARSWSWLVLAAFFYAGVVLSHLFHALVFTLVVGVYGIILLPRSLAYYLPLLTIPMGLLLSAFFWLPAFTERFFTRAQAGIYLEKSPFFVRYPHWTELVAWIHPLDARAANPYVPLSLGLVTLGLAALGVLAGIWFGVRKQRVEQISPPLPLTPAPLLILFFAVVAATATFLALPASRPVWDAITVLQVAEFPWRLLGLANLGLAFLAGAALLLLSPRLRLPVAIFCLAVQLLAVAPFLYPVVPFAQYGRSTIADQINYERRSQTVGTTGLSEYLPLTVSQSPTTSPLVKTFQADQFPERLDYTSLPVGAIATLLKQNAVTHIYHINSPTDFTLRLFHFDYPGWRAWLDDKPASLIPETGTGLMLIDIPAGQRTLTVHFGETPVRVIAITLTALTIVGLIVAGVIRRRVAEKRWRKGDLTISSKQKLNLLSIVVLLSFGLIIASALWLKPLLRPVFTVQSPPGQVLPAQYETNINFDNGIRLVGYDLEKTVVAPGDRLQVVLYWETDVAPLRVNLQPFVHLDRLNDWTTITGATNYTPGDVTTESDMPTFHWDNTRYVRDEHDLILPPTTPPIAYAVRAGLIDPDQNRLLPLANGNGDTAQLTIINVSSTSGQQARLTHQLNIPFSNGDDTIHLTGFELDTVTSERVDFRLAWQSDEVPQRDYTVFAQLLDTSQNLVASFDRLPLDGAYPTSTWLPGQPIIDPRYIPLKDVAPGEYRLIVGLYDSTTQKRLITDSGADFVELTQVTKRNPKLETTE